MAQNTHSLDLELDSTQFASITDASQTGLDITGNLTIEGWAKFETTPASGNAYAFAGKFAGVDSSYLFDLLNDAGTLKLRAGLENSVGTQNFPVVAWTPSTATWYHVAMVYDTGGNVKFYVDGSQQGATQTGLVTDIKNGDSAFALGARGDGALYFDGLLDDFRIWSTNRSETEILTNKNKQIDTFANLQGSWHLNNSYGDSSGNGNTLTASGSPVFSTDVPFTEDEVANQSFAYFM